MDVNTHECMLQKIEGGCVYNSKQLKTNTKCRPWPWKDFCICITCVCVDSRSWFCKLYTPYNSHPTHFSKRKWLFSRSLHRPKQQTKGMKNLRTSYAEVANGIYYALSIYQVHYVFLKGLLDSVVSHSTSK